jgi:maltose O-acetyltransferase
VQTGPVADPDPDADDFRTPRARMEAGDLHRVDDEIAGMHLRAVELCEVFNATPAADPDGRRRVLAELLRAFGPDAEIRAPFHCDYGTYLSIGARTFVNFGLVALDVAPIVIGEDVQIGPNVQLLTATHPFDAGLRRSKWEAAEPISIGNNVWLGGGVLVLPGVSIGQDTVVGAGTVVVRDLPAGVVAVGNPARIIRTLAGQVDGTLPTHRRGTIPPEDSR